MELTDSVMCDLHLDVHMGLNDNFSFSPRAMGSLSPNSVSSSCTSPDYGPFTPTSGRSTSPRSNSMDFGTSFDSYNSLSFDMTPRASAVSTSFSLRSSFTSDGSGLFLSDLPVTPTRSRVNTEFANLHLGGCGSQTQVSPSSAIPMYSFTETPQALGSTFNSTPAYGNNWDVSSMWVHPESPVNFEFLPVPSKGPDRSLDGVKKASAALQREQQKRPAAKRASRGATRRERKIQDVKFDPLGGPMPPPRKRTPCDVPGCTKTYRRPEHMVRHKISGHTNKRTYCAWCDHDANRSDNFSSHLKKHLYADSKNPRVKVITDPVERAKIEKTLATLTTRRVKGEQTEPVYKARPKCKTMAESECNTKPDPYKTEFTFKDEADPYKTEFKFKDEADLYKTEFKFKDEDE